MPNPTGRVNRGPAAAAENRQAILSAARRLLARDGFAVPLSAIAREAGVGQGVLYRHFSNRFDLAYAVFEGNFVELEEIAAGAGPGAFGRLWRRVLELTVRESAFVELMVESRATEDYDGDVRMRALIEQTLPIAAADQRVPANITVADVLRAWRMAFGIVITAEPRESAWSDLEAAGLLAWSSPA